MLMLFLPKISHTTGNTPPIHVHVCQVYDIILPAQLMDFVDFLALFSSSGNWPLLPQTKCDEAVVISVCFSLVLLVQLS